MNDRIISEEEYKKLKEDSTILNNLKDSLFEILEDKDADLLDVALKTMQILKFYD